MSNRNVAVINESVEMVDIHSLLPWPRNPRNGDLEVIAESIRVNGFYGALTVQKSTRHILVGNHRWMAALEVGLEEVPVAWVDVDDEVAARINLVDNRSGNLGWDDDALIAEILRELPSIEGTGYTDEALDEILAGIEKAGQEGLTDPDDVPEPPAESVTKRGDVWLLGRHRVMCGDATNATDVDVLLADAIPLLCVTDPPYGVSYDPAWRNRAAAQGRLAYAARRVGEVSNDDRADWSDAWALFPGDVIYSWHPPGATSLVHAGALEASGFVLRMQIIWAKSNFPIGRGDYHVRHEPCWYAVRKDKAARRNGDRTQTTLWQINLDKNVDGGHSTQKPVECMARPIRNHEAEEVYDPFSGSGTTIIAAEMLGRKCFALEFEPAYVDVICRRYQQYTGTLPVLESTGETHDFVEEG